MKTELGDSHCRYNIGSMDDSDVLFCNRIEKQGTHLRKVVPADIRLAVTVHHPAEGTSFSAIKYHWRIGKSAPR